jgi:hypothetical protein
MQYAVRLPRGVNSVCVLFPDLSIELGRRGGVVQLRPDNAESLPSLGMVHPRLHRMFYTTSAGFIILQSARPLLWTSPKHTRMTLREQPKQPLPLAVVVHFCRIQTNSKLYANPFPPSSSTLLLFTLWALCLYYYLLPCLLLRPRINHTGCRSRQMISHTRVSRSRIAIIIPTPTRWRNPSLVPSRSHL